MKSKVPKFNGADPEGWISQIDRLFNSYNAPKEWRLRLVSYHMEGRADDWFLWSLANNQLLTWTEFQFRLQQHFGCSIYESHFTKSKDTVTVGSENAKSENEKILIGEAISVVGIVQEEIGAEEFTVRNEEELPENLEVKFFNSSSGSESAHLEDSKLDMKFEAKNWSCGLPLSYGVELFPVVSLVQKVFDKITVRASSSFKEPDMYVNFWEPIQNFMEEKERNKNTHRSGLLFDPGGCGNISNIWVMKNGLHAVVQFLVGAREQINHPLKILLRIIPLSGIVAATKGRGCLFIHHSHIITKTILLP